MVSKYKLVPAPVLVQQLIHVAWQEDEWDPEIEENKELGKVILTSEYGH